MCFVLGEIGRLSPHKFLCGDNLLATIMNKLKKCISFMSIGIAE